MDSFLFVRCPAEQSRTVNARIGGQTAFMFPPGRLSKNTELEIGELLKSQVYMSFPPIGVYLTGVIRSLMTNDSDRQKLWRNSSVFPDSKRGKRCLVRKDPELFRIHAFIWPV